MKQITVLLILLLSSISGFAQIPKGYYFTDIKGTTWLSAGNIQDSAVIDAAEIGLSIYELHATDTISKNVWIFEDSLTIQCYDVRSKSYKTILTCAYENNEGDRIFLLKLKSGRVVTFEYTSVSTGTYVGLYKKKKKK